MTERSRTAVSLAKSEAQRMRHDFIGTEHLLLGLILEGTGLAAKVLADLGVDREWAREEAAPLVGPGTAGTMHVRLPLTPRPKGHRGRPHRRANLGHDYLGTEHLLLGLLDGEGVAAQMIANRGLTSEQLRAEILNRIPGPRAIRPKRPRPQRPLLIGPQAPFRKSKSARILTRSSPPPPTPERPTPRSKPSSPPPTASVPARTPARTFRSMSSTDRSGFESEIEWSTSARVIFPESPAEHPMRFNPPASPPASC